MSLCSKCGESPLPCCCGSGVGGRYGVPVDMDWSWLGDCQGALIRNNTSMGDSGEIFSLILIDLDPEVFDGVGGSWGCDSDNSDNERRSSGNWSWEAFKFESSWVFNITICQLVIHCTDWDTILVDEIVVVIRWEDDSDTTCVIDG